MGDKLSSKSWVFHMFIVWIQKFTCRKVSEFFDKIPACHCRVVKSSRLLAKIAAHLVSIGWLLSLALNLYGSHFLNEISPDWLLTLTTQPSTSKLSDNPGLINDGFERGKMTVGLIYARALQFMPFGKALHPVGTLKYFYFLNTGIQQARHLHGGSVFYVTGTTKQELFNTAEKMKESSVDDLSNCDLKTLSISPPDTSPDSFHEVPVDCPEEVPVDVPEGKNLCKPLEVATLSNSPYYFYRKSIGIVNENLHLILGFNGLKLV